MNKRLIYIAGYGGKSEYANWLNPTGFTNDIKKADLVLAIGGSDVSSRYYNQPDSGYLCCSPITDEKEYKDLKQAIHLGKKIAATCKGIQWLSALSGGAIFQHVKHPYIHDMLTFDNKTLLTNSLHHNMCDLSNLKENKDYKLLAWTNISPFHINGFRHNIDCEKEPEVVQFLNINAIGWQMHPEMFYHEESFEPTINWLQNIFENFMSN